MPLSNRYGPTGTCILADDLTGACDAAVAFASRGIKTQVLIQHEFADGQCEVLAISTATRDLAPVMAVEAILAQAKRLDSFPHIFKKVDSVFRGNSFVEVATSVRAFPGRLAIIAPAAPRHGRTCADGLLHIHDLSGHRTLRLRENLAEAGLRPTWLVASSDSESLAETMRTAIRNNADAFFCDAATDDHLAAIVQAARSLGKSILWVGSSGLAHALAQSLHPNSLPSPSPELPQGRILLFSGSSHPVTHAQLMHLSDDGSDVVMFHVERSQTTDSEIRESISRICASAACLVLNGGDTALQVCRALSMHAIRLTGEFAPGIPMGIASGGDFDGCAVILKSGGFGEADLLTRIARQSRVREEQPA